MEKAPQFRDDASFADRRRKPRSSAFGRQQLTVAYSEKGTRRVVEATLCDFSDEGLGMEGQTRFVIGETVEVAGRLVSESYSVDLKSVGKVVYCEKTGATRFRAGVAFKEVSIRPVLKRSERAQ